MAGRVTDYLSQSNQNSIREARQASTDLVSRWNVLGDRETLLGADIQELENLANRLQGQATIVIQGLGPTPAQTKALLTREMQNYSEYARGITELARMKMNPSIRVATPPPLVHPLPTPASATLPPPPSYASCVLKSSMRIFSEGEQRQIVETRINEFLNTPTATALDLSNLRLRSLPPVFHLNEFSTRLKTLNLGGNQLTELPTQIYALQNLQTLLLNGNRRLESLSYDFFSLPPSCTVNLANTGLTPDILDFLRDHQNSENYAGPRIQLLEPTPAPTAREPGSFLDVSNRLRATRDLSAPTPAPVPATAVRAPTTQNILNKWVNEAPAGEERQEAVRRITAFLNTPTATTLDLSNLGLTSLPPNLGGDPMTGEALSIRLRTLYLGKNKLTALPRVGHLLGLQHLYLNQNSALQRIPNEVLDLPHSCIVELTGIGASQADLENLRTQSTRRNGPIIAFWDHPPAAPSGQQSASIRGSSSLPEEPQPAPVGGPSESSIRAAHDSALGEQDIQQILKTWVRESSPGEQRQKAAEHITSFLTTPRATNLLLSDLGLRSLPPVFHLGREFSTRLRRLELGGNQLTALPPEIGVLRDLRTLVVRGNRLTALPPEIGELRQLQSLMIGGNQLARLPTTIGQLQALVELELMNNHLETLPVEISGLQELRNLSVISNRLTELPTTIGQLHNLTSLMVTGNQLRTLPTTIGELQNLTILFASDNQLRTLPTQIGQLRRLKELAVGSNRLETLPIEVGQLTSLESLTLYGNQLIALPTTIGQLQELTFLSLQNNKLRVLPNAIGQLRKLQTLRLHANMDLRSLENEPLPLPPSYRRVELEGTGLSLDGFNRLRTVNRLTTLPPQIGALRQLQSPAGPGMNFPAPEASPSGAARGGSGPGPSMLPSTEVQREALQRRIEGPLGPLFLAAKRQVRDFPGLAGQSPENLANLSTWLRRLKETRDYEKGGESCRNLAVNVLNYLDLAEKDLEFQTRFFLTIADANTTCGDRIALSVLYLSVAYKLSILSADDPRHMHKLKDLLIKGSWMLDQLSMIASQKIAELRKANPGFREDLEVYLAYPVQLKKALDLQIDVKNMLYFDCSQVTRANLVEAQKFLENQLAASQDAQYEILIKYPEWLRALESKYPRECAGLKTTRAQESDADGADLVQIGTSYNNGLVALTKRALGITP
jgi:Leucine-rich repeat (LRR) protein